MNFKLTYATMFNPPAEMHMRFDAALAELNRSLGATHSLYINGEDRVAAIDISRYLTWAAGLLSGIGLSRRSSPAAAGKGSTGTSRRPP